jgi:hypothetical protein
VKEYTGLGLKAFPRCCESFPIACFPTNQLHAFEDNDGPVRFVCETPLTRCHCLPSIKCVLNMQRNSVLGDILCYMKV